MTPAPPHRDEAAAFHRHRQKHRWTSLLPWVRAKLPLARRLMPYTVARATKYASKDYSSLLALACDRAGVETPRLQSRLTAGDHSAEHTSGYPPLKFGLRRSRKALTASA